MTRALALFAILVGEASAKTDPLDALALVPVEEVTATSTLPGKKKEPDRYAPWRVLQPRKVDTGCEDAPRVPLTAWCEGKADEGIGEAITIKLGEPRPLKQVEVAAGWWSTAKLFRANNRPTRIGLETDAGHKLTQAVSTKKRAWVRFALDGKPVSTVTLRILAVDQGRINDSCISEVRLDGGGALVAPGSIAAAAKLRPFVRAVSQALAKKRQALKTMLLYPFRYEHPDGTGEVSTFAGFKEVHDCKSDEGAPSCPGGGYDDEHEAIAFAEEPGRLALSFFGNGERRDLWHLVFRDGDWRLSAIDSELTGSGDPGCE